MKSDRSCAGVAGVLLAALVGLCACSERVTLPSPALLANGSLPHFEDRPGVPLVLSWVESEGEHARLRFATLADGALVPGGEAGAGTGWLLNWADVPAVAPITAEFWAAWWYTAGHGGGHAYDLNLVWSRDAGKTWSEARTPYPPSGGEHGFASVITGPVPGLAWLDGREVDAGGATALHVADIDGAPGTRIVDALVCDCCHTDFAPVGDGGVLVYRGRTDDETRDIRAIRFEGGTAHTPVEVGADGWKIAGCPVNGPAIAATEAGLAVVWPTGAGGRMVVRAAWSLDGGQTFGAPVEIDADGPLGRVAVTSLDDGDAAVSWLGKAEFGVAPLLVRRLSPGRAPGATTTIAHVPVERASGFPQLAFDSGTLWFAWMDAGRIRLATFDAAGLEWPG